MAEWRQELVRRLETLSLRPEQEAEIVEELGQHLDDQVRELLAGGVTPADARATALADLDAPGELSRRLAEIVGRQPLRLPPPGTPSRSRWLQARWQDLRYSLRSLRRAPGFTAAVILTLGLTIGPTTALLSVGNWLIWRPTPGVSEPERLGLATFGARTSRGDVNIAMLSYPNLEDLRRTSRTLIGITGLIERSTNVAAGALPAKRLSVGYVTAGFFDTLGVRIPTGRAFLPTDDELPNGERVAIISEGFARRVFGEPESALNQRVLVNSHTLTVIGVAPPEFLGIRPDSTIDLWIPGATYSYVNEPHGYSPPAVVSRSGGIFSAFILKLSPGASFVQAQAELDVLLPALAEQHPTENATFARVQSEITPGLGLQPSVRAHYGRMVGILLTVGGVLLLLGCANVVNLMTMRAVRGQRERAVRLALGASRARLILLQLAESGLLALGGAVAGLTAAFFLKEFVATLMLPGLAQRPEFSVPIDSRVLAMTTGIALACGLLAGLVPAWVGARTKSVGLPARAGGRTITGARRLRAGLATVQLALSLALVTAALMLVSTLRHFAAIDLGFDPSDVTAHRLDASQQGYPPERTLAYYHDVFQRVRSTPGWAGASLSAYGYGSNRRMQVRSADGTTQGTTSVWANAVTGSYFDVLGIRTIRGRVFTDAEVLAEPAVAPSLAIVSMALARRLFGGADAVGRRVVAPAVGRSPATEFTIIGVTNNANWNFTGGFAGLVDPTMHLYVPLTHQSLDIRSMALMVKSRQPIRDVGQRVEQEAMAVDPTLPIQSFPLGLEISYKLRDRITFAWVLSMLGWLGLSLAAVGLAGILAQSVAERTREFGIRIAVGSGRARIFGLVLRQAAWIGGIGTIAGLALAYWGSRLIEAQLYGVTRTSPVAYAGAAFALLVVVFLAGLWPARTATRIEPVNALRAE